LRRCLLRYCLLRCCVLLSFVPSHCALSLVACCVLRVAYNCCVFNYCVMRNNIFNETGSMYGDAFLYTNYSLRDPGERYLSSPMLDIASPTRWHQCKQESYEGTQLRQIKYIVNCIEQTIEGIHGHIYGTASETCNETGARPY
jgi:hypothetical protein